MIRGFRAVTGSGTHMVAHAKVVLGGAGGTLSSAPLTDCLRNPLVLVFMALSQVSPHGSVVSASMSPVRTRAPQRGSPVEVACLNHQLWMAI